MSSFLGHSLAAYSLFSLERRARPAHLNLLPALQTPTVSNLSDPDWVDVNTIVDESVVRHIVPQLKAADPTAKFEEGDTP